MTSDPGGVDQPLTPEIGTRFALRRVVVGYRLVSAAWLVFLGVVVLARGPVDGDERLEIVAFTVVAVLAWAVATAVVGLRAPSILSSPAWIAADVTVALWALSASSFAGTVQFSGGYPFSAVLVAVFGRSVLGGLVSALPLAVVGTVRLLAEGQSPIVAFNNAALLYILGAGVIVWGVEVLRAAERQRLAFEAALAREREERRRSAERAETAAHLHDSVLQTLALLQRRSEDPAEVTALARRQERELRDWLAGRDEGPVPAALRAALEQAAEDVERDHGVTVDVVVVGDAPLDDALVALVAATREALVNAAKHAGIDRVALYAEADSAVARVFVRDRGRGFDPSETVEDRRGLRESIVARLDRLGGSARVRSTPGAGTEVELVLPRSWPH